jgi:hypothetical protein
MADEQQGGEEKSLEMRVSEIEDKLAQMHVTEEEMKAYQKVSRLRGAGGGGTVSAGCILDCVGGCLNECRGCVVRQCGIVRACTIIRHCWECFECGPWSSGGGPFGGGFGGGGFGMLGG